MCPPPLLVLSSSFSCHVQTIVNCDLWKEVSLVGLANQFTAAGKTTQSTKDFSTKDLSTEEHQNVKMVEAGWIIIGVAAQGCNPRGELGLCLPDPLISLHPYKTLPLLHTSQKIERNS